MLELVLEKNAALSHAELKNCKATITLAAAVKADNEADPPIEAKDAVEAKGVFRLLNTGNAVDAVITAHGELKDAVDCESPAAIKASLTADATITVAFAEGETVVDTKRPWTWDAEETELDAEAAKFKAPAGVTLKKSDNNTLSVERDDAAKAARVKITFTGIEVASGKCKDTNCDGEFKINGIGDIHIDALCNWERPNGLKRHETHFRIRGVNSHAKVFTLGVPDSTCTADSGNE